MLVSDHLLVRDFGSYEIIFIICIVITVEMVMMLTVFGLMPFIYM
jgi:hypothetical protein